MNERIKELYRSCRSKEALASQDQYNSADVLIGLEVAKFSELIVRECATQFYLHGSRPEVCDMVLKHFGVNND